MREIEFDKLLIYAGKSHYRNGEEYQSPLEKGFGLKLHAAGLISQNPLREVKRELIFNKNHQLKSSDN